MVFTVGIIKSRVSPLSEKKFKPRTGGTSVGKNAHFPGLALYLGIYTATRNNELILIPSISTPGNLLIQSLRS